MNKLNIKKSKFRWANHNPVLYSVINKLPHSSILEFGMGIYSTKLLYDNYVTSFVSVEENKDWYDYMLTNLPPKKGFTPVYNSAVAGCVLNTFYRDITKKQELFLEKYYCGLSSKYIDIDVLFVDSFAVSRIFILLHLYKNCKIIIYHDTQEPNYVHNYMRLSEVDLSGYFHYSYQSMLAFKAPSTNFLIRKDIMITEDAFINELKLQEQKYFKLFNMSDVSKFKLVKLS